MPSRRLLAIIFLFWLSMIGWQLIRQYGQVYGAAPRIMDALEETAKDCEAVKDGKIHWTILLDRRRLGGSTSQVIRNKNLMFNLKQEVLLDGDLTDLLNLKRNLALLNRAFDLNLTPDLSLEMKSDTDVDYFGSLRQTNMSASVFLGKGREKRQLFNFYVTARAREGYLHLNGKLRFGQQEQAAYSLPADYKLRYDPKNLLLNSITPADVIPNLRLGQSWEAPMLDLQALLNPGNFTNIGKELTPPERKPTLVRVLNELRPLTWAGQEVPCFIAETRRPGLKVTVWVRQEDGRVLKQTAEWGDRVIEIVRQP